MKVGLVSYNFINNDIKYNLNQIRRVCEKMSGKVDLEKCDDSIYSSSIMISSGEIIHNYRKISNGWRDTSKTDEHYKKAIALETEGSNIIGNYAYYKKCQKTAEEDLRKLVSLGSKSLGWDFISHIELAKKKQFIRC